MSETPLIVFIVIGLPSICLTILFLTKMILKQGKETKKQYKDDDTEIIDHIYYGMKDIHKRVDNLETILRSKDRE